MRPADRRALVVVILAFSAFGSAFAGWDRLPIDVSIPASVEWDTGDRILVAAVRGTQHDRIDVGTEVTRWIRRELSRGTALSVLDVVPAPAIPEQRPEMLAVNDLFWKRLGEDFEADLIVAGICDFSTEDRSGFVTRDRIDAITGQMVRETVYADRTAYKLRLEIFVLKGDNGALLHTDIWTLERIAEGPLREDLHVLLAALGELLPDLRGVFVPTTLKEPRYVWID